MDRKSKKCLIKYINNLDLHDGISCSIKRTIMNYGEMVPITLYRGQKYKEQKMNKINSEHWFSTSLSIDVAKDEFAGDDGIVFIIHVDNAMVLDVNLYLTSKDIGEHWNEQEFIVQGGGKFYTNSSFQNEGYVYRTPKLIETWYHIQPIEIEMNDNKINNDNDNVLFISSGISYEDFYELNYEELEFISNKEELYIFKELKNLPISYIDELYEYILEKKRSICKNN